MARIHELLKQVSDPALRARLEEEVERLTKNKKFGLVFEEHIPECTPLYDVPIKRGATVARNAPGKLNDVYRVLQLEGNAAVCCRNDGTVETIPLDELIAVAQFGDPIYPYLQPIDSVCKAPDSGLWHTLIEADNYHALQLLEYLYAGKVDCIYIDPPYNTGEDEWKYNDVFVDSSDHWAHSKWLSMIKKRLLLAKNLLTQNGILIISIGYQELHHLCVLCEDIFTEKQIVPVTVQTSGGKPSGGFNYLQEYLVFITPSDFSANPMRFSGGNRRTPFEGLTLTTFDQTTRPNQTYPIFIDVKTECIVGCGASLTERIENGSYIGEKDDFVFDYSEAPEGCVAVWPISKKGNPCVWRLIQSRLLHDWGKGYIRVIKNKSAKNPNQFSVQYLPDGIIKKVKNGELEILGTEDGKPTLKFGNNETEGKDIPTIWTEKSFYTVKGTGQIDDIFGTKVFQYPKPIDLMAEIIRACTSSNSLIIDFFAGSGTTLNAINLVNEEDDGMRRCILVTNNEVSKKQSKILTKNGFRAGDPEWEARGICHSITWPRIVFTVLGKRNDNNLLDGKYPPDDEGYEKPMSDGFAANCEYFKLSFLDKDRVSLGLQFREILPLLWLKAGAKGRRPEIDGEDIPEMLVLPENGFAVLTEETAYASFAEQLAESGGIDTVFFVTNSEAAFREMSEGVEVQNTFQLYRDYLENFKIGARRAAQ